MHDFLLSPTGSRLRTIIGGVLIFIALLATPFLARINIDNSLERWVEQDSKNGSSHAMPGEGFENLLTILIQVSGDSLYTERSLDSLVNAFDALESIPSVLRVEGVPAYFKDQYGLEDSEALKEEMRNSPYFQHFYVSPDLKHMAFFVVVEPEKLNHSNTQLIDDIGAITQSLEEENFKVTTVGPLVLNAELNRLSLDESIRLFPFSFGLSILVLYGFLRSFRATLIAIISAGLTLILLMECVALSGYSLNMITISLPPLIWVLSLSASIHIILRFLKQQHEQDDVQGSVHAALAETAFPNTFASLTTGLGFLSLSISDMAPVKELGMFVALGMLVTIAVNLTVTPLLLGVLNPKQRERTRPVRKRMRKPIHPRRTIVSVVCIAVLIIPGAMQVRSEMNPLSMFSADSAIHQQYASLSAELAAPAMLETIVQLPTQWQEPETWPIIEQVVQRLQSHPIAIKTLSPLDGLRLLNYWNGAEGYPLPQTREEAEALLSLVARVDDNLFQQFVHQSGTEIRIITFVDEMSSDVFLSYVDTVNQTLESLPEGYSGYTTGTVLNIVRAQKNLSTNQYKSFGLAFGVIFICMFFGFRSWRLLLLSILPNILPSAVVFGLMGYWDISLNTGTIMVASVVLGIGVDDTVHMLVGISRASKNNNSLIDVVHDTLDSISPALITTTSVIGSGFLVLSFSKFLPTTHFGILATLAIVVALWADLCLVPALLLFNRKESSS